MQKNLKTLLFTDDSGSFLAEYGLITGTVATALIGVLGLLTDGFTNLMDSIEGLLTDMGDDIENQEVE